MSVTNVTIYLVVKFAATSVTTWFSYIYMQEVQLKLAPTVCRPTQNTLPVVLVCEVTTSVLQKDAIFLSQDVQWLPSVAVRMFI